MFCPVCEAEYQPGITRCHDDNTELVERLDPTTGPDDSEARFLPLHRLGSPVEAEMVNDILTQNGIRSMVKSGGADAFSPLGRFGATPLVCAKPSLTRISAKLLSPTSTMP